MKKVGEWINQSNPFLIIIGFGIIVYALLIHGIGFLFKLMGSDHPFASVLNYPFKIMDNLINHTVEKNIIQVIGWIAMFILWGLPLYLLMKAWNYFRK